MGKSARVLGREFGRSAREMNELLKAHGYLYGKPGAYGLTEKGRQYGQEQHHSRGTGGSAQYNPQWETRTWSDETASALWADMEANPGGGAPSDDVPPQEAKHVDPGPRHDGSDERETSWKEVAAIGMVAGAFLAAPHVKPFWHDKLKPAARSLRRRFAKGEPGEGNSGSSGSPAS
ncbi:hypothetical protein H9Y04_41000 [Streptomyces sp. TRM66268-LWL]|uniref:Uncharacterized protein n=1 Tax=Streptomyces polyasparticus TaxID=2767826 RepID=A0ABR7STW4_9ACTN|nr:hypothetical protein [Streptomyces polyasparticus]MBC9718924.1 hypothetical protein [Streptomyces polyasparticus]